MKKTALYNQYILVIGLIGILLSSCVSKKNSQLQVSVTISNLDLLAVQYPQALKNGMITAKLYEVPFGEDQSPVQLDSTTITAGGKSFILKGITNTSGMYDIVIDDGPMIPLINDAENIKVSIDFGNKNRFYDVQGSEASGQLRNFIFEYSEKVIPVNKSLATIDSLKRFAATDSLQIEAANQKNKSMDDLNRFLVDFLNKVNQPVVASFALGRAAQSLPQEEFEKEMNKLAIKFPEDAQISELKSKYDVFKQRSADIENMRKQKSWVGKAAPELVLPDANGKEIALSSFKGKYVLVDFWASWCGPCRIENPNVVAAYNKFKQKNFTILGVSLDKTRDAWLGAIRQDGLNWTHVSDLAFWNSKAVSTFGFEGIPFSVLIDPQGTVIAESLRGEDLHNKLNEVLQ